MALTVTDRGTDQTTAGGTTQTKVSSAFTPADGSLLVVAIASNGTRGAPSDDSTWSVTSSPVLTFTQRALCTRGAVAGYRENVVIYTAPVVGSASTTVTVTESGGGVYTDGWIAFHIWEVGGEHASPIGLTASPAPVTSGTTFNTDLGSTPAATSAVFGAVHDDALAGGAVEPSGWTESDQQTPAWGATSEWAYKIGSVVQSPQWSGMNSGDRLLGAAVEILAAADDAFSPSPSPVFGPGSFGTPDAWQWLQQTGIDATVSADVNVTLPDAAAVTVTANNVTVAVSVSVGVAAVTATANQVTANPAASVGSAAVTVTANNASHTIASTIGSAAVTVAANNTGISNAHAVGNAAVTVTGNNAAPTSGVNVAVGSAAVRVVAQNAQSKWPTTVSANGRYILDQNGDPWMMHGDTAWDLVNNISILNAIVYLDDRGSRGVNLVIVEMEHFFSTAPPANFYGDLPFTGTAYQTGLNEAYWANVDAVIDHAAARGITVMFFPAYIGASGSDEGWNDEMVAASNANMDTFGAAIGNRYATRSNIIWAIGGDKGTALSGTELDRLDHIGAAIAGTSDNHLITAHTNRNHDAAEFFTSYTWLNLNSIYTADPNTVSISATGYNRSTVRPTFYIEGKYENFTGITLAQIRREQWQCVLVGGLGGHVVGNEDIWSFGFNTGFGTDYDWNAALGDASITHSHQIRVLFDTVTSYVWKSLAPDLTDTFLTSGESSGTTQAAASFSNHLGLVYVATTGSITVDLTELSGAATVLARWFDPTNGSFTSVGTFATSAPQVITHPGANAAGDNDWVLTVVDATVNVTVGSAAVSVTANNATVTTSSNVNVTVGSAAVSVTANNSSSAVAHAVGNAATAATANNVTANPAPSVGLAAVTVTANNSSSAVAHAVGNAAVTVTGNNVTVTTTSDVNVAVGVAAVTATANNAGVSAAHAVGVAAVTVTGNNVAPTSGVNVSVGVATVTAAANNSSAQVAAAVVAALVIVTAYDTFVDDGAGVATYASLVRMRRPKIVKRSR